MMPMFVKWDGEQKAAEERPDEEAKVESAEEPAVEVEVEGTEAVAEAEEVETTSKEEPNLPARKPKRPRKKAETAAG